MAAIPMRPGGWVQALPLCALLSLAVMSAARGQSNTSGYIVGEAASGAGPVPGATVTARNVATGLTRTTVSGERGRFRISALAVGRYAVTAAAPGGIAGQAVLADVSVGEGTVVNPLTGAVRAIEEIVVAGRALAPVDVTQSEITTVITSADIARLPIPRDPNAVALLAPGAVYGDAAFGVSRSGRHYGTGFGFASLGGASVAENSYYINGMNVTNFRNGLGGSTVPFEFYDQFQIKTGGYGAEFGRSTGGVVNAVTRRGSNEWRFSTGVNYAPDAWRGKAPNVGDPTAPGEYVVVYENDAKDEVEAFVTAGGPVVEDRLLVYGIYNFRDIAEDNFTGGGELRSEADDDGFWGLKLDWLISDGHSLEYTGFSDERTTTRTTFEWDEATDALGARLGETFIERGGRNDIVKYTGLVRDDLTVSALLGANSYALTTAAPSDSGCPAAYDSRGGTLQRLGCWTRLAPSTGHDERAVARLDIEWSPGSRHVLRFGADHEDNTSTDASMYSGGEYFRYFAAVPSEALSNGVIVPAGVTELTRYRRFSQGGEFDVTTTAVYIEDEWTLTDRMTWRLGLRNERFDNRNAHGETFIRITEQYAPRIGFAWDIGGEGTDRLLANYGRYHLPIASNTNIRLAGAELFTEEWFVLDGPIAEDGSTTLGEQLGPTSFFGDGTVPDVRTTIDLGIEPMYQDEFILGYERQVRDAYLVSLTYTHRDLRQGIEDITIDAAIDSPGAFHYVLANPGRGVHTFYDVDGDGNLDELRLSADELGFAPVKRRYQALTLGVERQWDGVFYLKGLYTWSHSYGNYEGMVRSDNGQTDAGLTTQYDFAGLLEGADGDLPNDRRHQVKLWGAWQLGADWQVSGALQFQSGRPRNAFGLHPSDPFARRYGAESFFNQGTFTPRGSLGRTENTLRLDVGLKYTGDFSQGALTARLDIFNVFDWEAVTEVDEFADEETGAASATFGLPTRFQQPRTVRVGLQYDFGPN